MNEASIFILDDDPSMRVFFKAMISSFELNCLCFSHPDELAQELKTGNIPLACFLDINLSDQNIGEGFTFIKAIRNKISTPFPIFAISRRSSPEDVALALENGADEYLPKPIDPFVLKLHLSLLEGVAKGVDLISGDSSAQGKPILENFRLVEKKPNFYIFTSDYLEHKRTSVVLSFKSLRKIFGEEFLENKEGDQVASELIQWLGTRS